MKTIKKSYFYKVNKIKNNSVILFDGTCSLCNYSVQFILKTDIHSRFVFASLESSVSKKLLKTYRIKNLTTLDTIILIDKGKAYTKSSAILNISKKLRFPLNILYTFIIVPKYIRDFLYDMIARNRYKFFGKKEHCILPDSKFNSRFLK